MSFFLYTMLPSRVNIYLKDANNIAWCCMVLHGRCVKSNINTALGLGGMQSRHDVGKRIKRDFL